MLSESQVHGFKEDGYIIVKKLFSDAEIAPIINACYDTNLLDQYASSNKDFSGNPSFRAAFWRDPNGSTLLAKMPLMPRMVTISQQLLATEVYYWRSRLVYKKPYEPGRIEYHQDFSYWYRDGCVFPDMVSCSVAVTPTTKANGCLEILKGSHKVGRLDLDGYENGAEYPDPRCVAKIAEQCDTIYCELEPGDAVFFHANSLHGSAANSTQDPRVVVYSTYNAKHNAPLIPEGQSALLSAAQSYEPIKTVSDQFILENNYDHVFDKDVFFPAETSKDNPVGIFKREAV